MPSAKAKGVACMVASAFGFALMAFFVRLCDDYGGGVSCFQKSFFRNVVAFAVALPVFLRSRRGGRAPAWPGLRASGLLLLRSALGTAGLFANFYALGLIPIAESQALNKTAPFFTLLFAWAFLREKATLRQVGTLAIAFAGVVLVAKPGFAGEAAVPLALGLLGGVCAGAAYTCVRSLRKQGVDPALIVLVFSVFSCLASLPFAVLSFDPMTPAQVLILVGAGCGAALGQFGITLAYGYAPPGEIAVYDYSNILFTAVFGYAFFSQMPDALSLAGFAAILAAAVRLHASPRRAAGR